MEKRRTAKENSENEGESSSWYRSIYEERGRIRAEEKSSGGGIDYGESEEEGSDGEAAPKNHKKKESEESEEEEEGESVARLMADVEQTEEERLSESYKRERNRIAARKSREKKAKYINTLKEEIVTLTMINDDLLTRLDKMTDVSVKVLEEVNRVLDGGSIKIEWLVNLLVKLEDQFSAEDRVSVVFQRFKEFLADALRYGIRR